MLGIFPRGKMTFLRESPLRDSSLKKWVTGLCALEDEETSAPLKAHHNLEIERWSTSAGRCSPSLVDRARDTICRVATNGVVKVPVSLPHHVRVAFEPVTSSKRGSISALLVETDRVPGQGRSPVGWLGRPVGAPCRAAHNRFFLRGLIRSVRRTGRGVTTPARPVHRS